MTPGTRTRRSPIEDPESSSGITRADDPIVRMRCRCGGEDVSPCIRTVCSCFKRALLNFAGLTIQMEFAGTTQRRCRAWTFRALECEDFSATLMMRAVSRAVGIKGNRYIVGLR
jgi:hypothetical protein